MRHRLKGWPWFTDLCAFALWSLAAIPIVVYQLAASLGRACFVTDRRRRRRAVSKLLSYLRQTGHAESNTGVEIVRLEESYAVAHVAIGPTRPPENKFYHVYENADRIEEVSEEVIRQKYPRFFSRLPIR